MNGHIEAGETAKLAFPIKNIGHANSASIIANLSTESSFIEKFI